jgi:hypothetical protein
MEIWGDGSGGAAALALAAAAGSEVEIASENELWVHLTLSGVAATSVTVNLEVSFDGGSTWVERDINIDPLDGAVADHLLLLRCPVFCQVRLRLARTGGGAGSLAYAAVYLRAATGIDESVEDETTVDVTHIGGTAVADAADGVVPVSSRLQILSGPTSIFDNGAGAKEAITDDYVDNASGFINLDDRTTDLSIIVDKDTANPTSLEVEVLWDTLTVAGGAAIATAFYMPAVNSVGVVKGRADVSPLEVSWDGRAAATLPDGRYRWVFQRPAEAASYNVRIKRTGGAGTEAQVWAIELA